MTNLILDGWKQVLQRGDSPEVIRECRRCGIKLNSEDDYCPKCGSGEIAGHEI